MDEDNRKRLFKAASQHPGSLGITEDFDYQCQDGWFEILHDLFFLIAFKASDWTRTKALLDKWEAEDKQVDWAEKWLKENPEDPYADFKIVQVKEKFGGLRVYYEGSYDTFYIDGLIAMAESQSTRTCEVCGMPGKKTVPNHWIMTRCVRHGARAGCGANITGTFMMCGEGYPDNLPQFCSDTCLRVAGG